eukprot:scaffold23301_cov74-Phaeocystis_antarctica.AAC.1
MNERNPALSYALSRSSSSSCSGDAGSRLPASSSAAQPRRRVQYGSSTCTRYPRRGPTAANDSTATPCRSSISATSPSSMSRSSSCALRPPPPAGRRYRLPVASKEEQHLESERRPAILRQCRARRPEFHPPALPRPRLATAERLILVTRRSPTAIQQPHSPPCNSAHSASRARASAAEASPPPACLGMRGTARRATSRSIVEFTPVIPLSRRRRARARAPSRRLHRRLHAASMPRDVRHRKVRRRAT